MKRRFDTSVRMVVVTLSVLFAFISCEYEDYVDVNYPKQTIYMPAALHGLYDISVQNDPVGVPTEGVMSRYSIDNESNQLNVHLGVYRSGITSDGEFSVGISLNTDTIAQMINLGSLVSTEVLPSDKVSMPSSVTVKNNSDISTFDLSINLDFIKNNPDKQYAIGVVISSSERTVNPKFKTAIVFINTNSIK
ncbi:MAG: DUF1735 domain-containing protein [Draconibacterium sp.]